MNTDSFIFTPGKTYKIVFNNPQFEGSRFFIRRLERMERNTHCILSHDNYLTTLYNDTLYIYVTNNSYDQNGKLIVVFLYKNVLYGTRKKFLNSYGTIELIG